MDRAVWACQILGVIAVATGVGLGIFLRRLDPSIVRLQLSFTRSGFESVWSRWSATDRERYRLHFVADVPFLACYGVAGYLFATRSPIFESAPTLGGIAALSIVSAALADLLEDVIHLVLTRDPDSPLSALPYLVAGISASTKFALIVAFLAACALACWL